MKRVEIIGRFAQDVQASMVGLNGNYEDCLFLCRFVVAEMEDTEPDLYVCIAFDNIAKIICQEYQTGNKEIRITGKLKNFFFKDMGGANQFTNIILVDSVNNIVLHEQQVLEHEKYYDSLRDSGYLAINEDDFYDIASKNYEIVGG